MCSMASLIAETMVSSRREMCVSRSSTACSWFLLRSATRISRCSFCVLGRAAGSNPLDELNSFIDIAEHAHQLPIFRHLEKPLVECLVQIDQLSGCAIPVLRPGLFKKCLKCCDLFVFRVTNGKSNAVEFDRFTQFVKIKYFFLVQFSVIESFSR